MSDEMAGFEFGVSPATASDGQHRESYGLRLSQPGETSFRCGRWGLELVVHGNGWRRIIINLDGEEVIHVDGPPGTTATLLQQALVVD